MGGQLFRECLLAVLAVDGAFAVDLSGAGVGKGAVERFELRRVLAEFGRVAVEFVAEAGCLLFPTRQSSRQIIQWAGWDIFVPGRRANTRPHVRRPDPAHESLIQSR